MKHALLILAALFVIGAQAQDNKEQASAFMVVQSHQMCNSCIELIQEEMKYEKGVEKIKVDTDTYEILVDYNPKKTDKPTIRKAIAALGVDADDVKADPKGIEKLPACCKNEGCGKPKAAKKEAGK